MEDLKSRAAARREVIRDGRHYSGVSVNCDMNVKPSWYEPDSFRHAQRLFEKYSTIIRISQLYGLNLVLYHSSGLTPLLVTGNSQSIAKLFIRYLSTMKHVTNWFTDDPFDKESKAYNSLKMVRGMHLLVGSKMNKSSGFENGGDDHLWISQYGMAHAQFSFVGFMAVFPKELGFHNFTHRDFHSMFHFWRVIGYCLGTDDKYNLCSGSDEEIVELCKQIYFEEWLPVIREGSDKGGIAMSKGICLAMSHVNSTLNFNALMRYGADFLRLDKEQYRLEGVKEKVRYMAYVGLFRYLSHFDSIHWIIGKVGDLKLDLARQQRHKVTTYLEQKYSDIHFANDRCPFDVTFKYVDAFQCEKK